MTEHPDVILNAVIRRLNECAPAGWTRLVLNWEVEPDEDGDLVTNSIKFAVVAQDESWTESYISYDSELYEHMDALYRGMGEVRGRRWSSVDLVVDVDGTHRVSFDYGHPRRLGGDLADPRFDDYTEQHRAELEALTAGQHAGPGASADSGPAGLQEQEELIQAVIERFAAIAPQGWARLAGNWEAYDDEHGSLTLNYITVAVVNGGTEWLYGQVDYDAALYGAVITLNERMSAGDEQRRWTVFDLEVDADPPAYRVDFGYDPPKRAGGVYDYQSLGRFQDYLQTWIDTHGPTP